ncbi:putative uncharacterized protein DDB_G0282133 [Aphis gossypii]|uniref:putative uncharacterized protein DDB_G0282133 n=1 Tax=Aphis gossypii TaxID=80765 RepID=UPI002158A5A5|nr:putative uncharacterized protein DDB_G0282133 [Aphis gossypii]XP_027845148.2 putative uncharacterized protein DDB_G0282133 [Aphis gossypii]
MLNSLRDGQINYGTTNCQSTHVPPHNVVAPIHQNSLISTEPTTPVYQWNTNHRLEHLYGFHSRYYNLDFPTPYPPATNQYVPANVYGQNLPQCCQPCCRLRSQNMPKASPPQVLYNPRPVQQLNRSYKSKKTLKTPCSEQFLPYIPNDLPVKYDTQNCYQQKYNSSYLNNTNYCPPANNLWIQPAANPNWSTDRLRPIGRHTSVVSHDFSREKNYQRLPNYQSNPYLKPSSGTHHIPYNYIPPIPDVHDYRPPIYHNALKNNTTEYVSHDHNSRLPISSQNIQNAPSLQQYYNTQPVPYSDVQLPNSESFKPPQIAPKDNSKSNLNVREFLATWDEGEEEIAEKSSETTEPIVVLDCMTLDGDALTKIQEKLNVVSYENLEKVLKENQNPLVITTEPNEINSFTNKPKLPSKSNFEPLDYTKRETGIIKPFNTEKKTSSGSNVQPEKSYSVNFDGMVAWYGKKNADISSTDLIEKLADRIFNLSKSQENDGVSFGTAAYTGQITQTNRSIESSDKNTSKYIQSSQMFDLQHQHHVDKCIEHPLMNKMNCNKDSIPRVNSFTLNESDKSSTVKSNNANSSCIVENITKRCLNVTNEDTTPWNLDQGIQEQHLNTSLYDHSVIMKPLDFSSLTDETKGNPFVFEKITSNNIKPNDSINNQCNKVFNEHNSYNSTVSNNQHSIQQIDTVNRNFPVIVSPHRSEYNGFHESVIQRTGCDKNKHDKVSTQTDFESINWNLSNDLDKIMKNENMVMEPSCLYDRNNYNILDSMNSDKNVSTRWKDNVPCVDLTVNCKTNPHHDSFFDGWSFIDSYENHTSKKIMNTSSNNNSHHSLFPNQMTSLEESTKNNNNSCENTDDTFKDVPPFSKSNDLSPTNRQSRDVFNLNNRIPDFSDGFELSAINEPHEYLQFKKDDNEHRADGSIFEHLNEPKCVTTLNETLTYKNDQNKLDFIGLPSFKEKEPLAPVSAPSKLNIVKPTLRDPSQTYTVIKQKLKYNNTCADNDSVVTNKTENNLKEHLTNSFNVMDLKSKYNSVQLNQFDVWSEKFVLKGNSNSSSSAVVQCDVEITQFKSTPENRNSLPKSNMNENYQDKTMMLPENTNCNLAADKINIIEHEKINSNDFLHCLENTKTDDQKYRDTFDEFETSFGFDIHCNNESNKSFHEDIVDKCFEERIKDQIDDRNINTVESNNTSNSNTSSNNTQLPFQCDFQSSYLIKNYFDENKNKTVNLNQKQTNYQDKSDTTVFKYHDQHVQEFELQNNESIHSVINSEKNSNFIMDTDIGEIQKSNENNNLNLINEDKSCENKPENTNNVRKISSIKNNNFDYLNVEDRNLKLNDNKKSILESTISKEKVENNSSAEANIISQIKQNDLNSHKLFHIRTNSNADFELNNINANIFESNPKSTSIVSSNEANKNNILGSPKNSVESKYNSDNIEKIERNINKKNIFEFDNNNINIHNLEKMDEFDFNTRIIQNLGIECSSVDVEKPISSNERFTNENRIKASCGFEINDNGNKVKLETNYKNTLGIQEKLRIGETSDLNCNNDIQCHDVIETENINCENKVDRIFEIGCIVNNIQEKQILDNPKAQTDFITQNKNAEKFNLNNCNTKVENNSEVENIFENIYDNLSTLDSVKNDTNILDEDDLKRNASKCLEINKNPSLKNKNLDGVDEPNMDVVHNASEETFDETNNVLLQELVNNSVHRLTTVSVPHNESINEIKSKSTLLEYSTDENLSISVEQLTKDIEEDKGKSNNVTNRESIKNLTANKVKSDATLTLFENLKSDLFNATKNADEKYHAFELTSQQNPSEMHEVKDSTYSEAYLLSHVEMTHHQNSNRIIEIKDLMNCGPSILNHNESISKQPSLENVQAVDLTSSRLTSLNHDKSTPQQNPNKIYEIEESISTGLTSLNHTDLISKQNSNAITNGVDNSINYDYTLLSHNELKCQQYPDKRVENEDSNISLKHDELQHHKNINKINEIKDSTSPEPISIKQDKIDLPKNSNAIYEAEDLTKSNPTSINQNELNYYQNLNEDEDSIHSEPCSINQDEFELQKNSNAINDLEDLTMSETSSINQDELEIPKNSNAINDLEDLVDNSEPCSINRDKLEFQQNENGIYEAEDLSRSRPSSINQDELKIPKNLNAINEPEDLITSESCSINQDKLEFQRNENEIYENEDSISCGSRSINQDELEYHKHLNEMNEDEDSTSFGSSSINQDELEKPKNSNAIDNPEDLVSSKYCSINQDKLEFQQNANEMIENEDSIISRPNSINQDELEYHKSLNEMNEDEDSLCSGPSSINQDELEKPKNSNAINDLKDLVDNYKSCSINQDELKFQQNENGIYEAEDLSRSRHSSINQDELKIPKNLNAINEPEDLVTSESCSINQDKLEFQQNENEIYENEDSISSRPSSINQDELEYHKNLNEIYEDENSTSSGSSSINQDKLKLQHNSNEIYDSDDDLITSRPSSIDQDELEIQKNSKVNDEPEDHISSKSCSINQGKLEFQQNINEIYEAEDLTRFKPSSINQDELEIPKNSNTTVDPEDLVSSEYCSINQDILEFQQNENEIYENEDSISSGPSSINQDELEYHKNLNEIYEDENSNSSGSSSITQDELEYHKNLNEIYEDENSTGPGSSSINQDELEKPKNTNAIDNPEDLVSSEQNLNEINEAVDLTISRPSLLNHVDYKSQHDLNKTVKDKDLIGSVESLLKTNCDTYIDPKSVVNNIKLSKVKFMLKCHNRNMIKTNIFEEEPTVPCKKLKLAKDEKLMSHHIFKKRNTCNKQCTSLQSMYKKELNIELNDNNLKDLIKNTDIPLITIHPDNIAQVVRTPSEGEQYDSKFVSLVDQMYDHDRKQNDEVEVKSDMSDDDEYSGPLITPIPSPFDDFQSENTTPEHCGGEVYWDKSLEDEYKSVLHKTISKLAKVRVNVRDKFNSRLLARRVIETKRRKREWQQRQLLVADKTAVVIVGHVEDTVKPVVTAVKVSTSPMYKIKVQLPWGRIFNMNGPKGSRNKTKDTTKIELGPAKVEVRLSQTPGEWQVAACQPMTSPKSVVFVRRLVLQRATSPVTNDCDVDDHYHNHRQDDNGHGTNDNRSHDFSRKLPKIVIRRNGQDNNYTSYVSSSGFENGDANDDGGNDDKNDNGGGVPQLMVRLVRDRKLDAMAVEGVTTLHLKHLVPISESKMEASVEMDMHCAKRVRYS